MSMPSDPIVEQVSRQYLDIPALAREMLPPPEPQQPRCDFRNVKITAYWEKRELLYQAVLDHKLSWIAKSLLLVLEHYGSKDNVCIFPNQATIAMNMGISRETVTRAIDELVEQGYIAKKRRGECPCKLQRLGNHYRLTRLGYDNEAYYDAPTPAVTEAPIVVTTAPDVEAGYVSAGSHTDDAELWEAEGYVSEESPTYVSEDARTYVSAGSPVTLTTEPSSLEPGPTVATLPSETPAVASLPLVSTPTVVDPRALKRQAKAKPKAKKVKAHLLREDFVPSDENLAWAASKGLQPDLIAHETEAFNLYWQDRAVARPGWSRSWMRWLLKRVKPESAKTVWERRAERDEMLTQTQMRPGLALRPGEDFDEKYKERW